jgi:hypothetical protein
MSCARAVDAPIPLERRHDRLPPEWAAASGGAIRMETPGPTHNPDVHLQAIWILRSRGWRYIGTEIAMCVSYRQPGLTTYFKYLYVCDAPCMHVCCRPDQAMQAAA